MYSDAMLESIVEKVLQKLEQRRKTALVIFTGAAIGFNEVMPQLKALLDEGWNFKVVLSNSAEYVHTPQLIKKMLGIDEVFLERETKALSPLYRDVGLIIIPTLSLNSAVKIALGVADTLACSLAAHAMMSGIPIVAVRNGCDLRDRTRLQLGMDKTPQAYLARTDQYLSMLESYGIELVEAGELYKKVRDRFVGHFGSSNNRESGKKACHFDKKVLSRVDVVNAKNENAAIYITRNTIVTTLAYDAAKELGVEIIRG